MASAVRLTQAIALFACAFSVLACRPVILEVTETRVSYAERPLAAAATNALLLSPSSYDSIQSTLSVSGVPAGRIYSYAITEAGAPVSGLVCRNLPDNVRVSSPMIHVDLGLQDSNGTLELDCADDEGSFGFQIGYTASKIAMVSSSLDAVSSSAPTTVSNFVASTSGRYVVWSDAAFTVPHQAYLRDLQTGVATHVSVTADGSTAADSSVTSIAASEDGSKVIFASAGTAFGATGGFNQIYAKNIATGAITLLSSSDGTVANRANSTCSTPVLSSNGRYVAFVSTATNLVAGASGSQIYRKDLQTGALELVSSLDGTAAQQGGNTSISPVISSDGRYIAFTSQATNWVAGTTATAQIYRKDMQTATIALVSSTDGTGANRGNAASSGPHMTTDGRYVVFLSASTNLAGATTLTQVFRKDMQTGAIALVSSTDGTAGNRGNNSSSIPRITPDGRYVGFVTNSTNLVAGSTGSQAFRKDMQTGTIVLASSTDGTAANRASLGVLSYGLDISSDGDTLFFVTSSANLLAELHSYASVRKRITAGTIDVVSTLGSTAAFMASENSDAPEMSADGRYVVFWIYAGKNLVTGMSNTQIVRKDMQTGSIALVSSVDGTAAQQSNAGSAYPDVSADGRYVVFQSSSTNLIAGATASSQIYLKDMQTGTISIVSSLDGTAAQQGNSTSRYPQITPDGRYVVFESGATNFVAGSANRQIFRKDLQTGTIALVSSTDGTGANRANTTCDGPQVTPDGRYVTFWTMATNLVPGANNTQIYRKDMQTGVIALVSSTDGTAANRGDDDSYYTTISDDGRYIAFYSDADNLVGGVTRGIFRKDMQTGAIALASTSDGVTGATGSHDYPEISSDGRYILWQAAGGNIIAGIGGQQVVRKDMQTGAVLLVTSKDNTVANEGGGGTLYGELSPDGSLAVVGTSANNFVHGTGGNRYHIYMVKMPVN